MRWLFLIIGCLFSLDLSAQKSGLRGKVSDEKGNPIPFASIGVEKVALGTMANEEGSYRLDLAPGNYVVYFQCLGFKTVRKEISISKGWEEATIVLNEQVIQTKDVTIASRNEDPAYAIMRKAIARARINKLMVDAYTAEAYIRGSGRILELPFFLRGMARDNGFDENTVFFKETREILEFSQPNTFKERVIASRSTFGMAEIQQNFLKEDLYAPEFGGSVSPLSPAAFRTYRFEYLGAFTDRGHEVFKIKVIPKVDGSNVWAGEIFIIDQIWCIHSARLSGLNEGFNLTLTHQYAPFEGIWMPVQQRQEIRGKVLQIRIEAIYNAVIRKYVLKKNQKLYADFQKIEEEINAKTDDAIRKAPEKPDFKAVDKLDKKTMRKLAKTYLKEKIKNRIRPSGKKTPTPHLVSDFSYSVDTSAAKKDSAYWAENRDVPLTEMEIKSFHKLDSIRVVEEKKDSVDKKKSGGGGEFMSFLMGRSFAFGKKDSLGRSPLLLKWFSPLKGLQFNAEEGYVIEQELWLKMALRSSRDRIADDRTYLQFGPKIRYSFAREKVLGSGIFQFGHQDWTLELGGGMDMRQYHPENPISVNVNTSYAILDRRNLIRLYESEFLRARFLRKLTSRFEGEIEVDWENRIPVANSPNVKNLKGKVLEFEPNLVVMPYVTGLLPQGTQIYRSRVAVDWYPSLVASMYNGRIGFHAGSSPRIRLEWTQAYPFGSIPKPKFSKIDLSYRQSLELPRGSRMELFFRGAGFLQADKIDLMDAIHVLGNRTFLVGGRSVESFRNLPYYAFSNRKPVFEGHFQWYRNEILAGWFFPKTRNWKEMVLLNGMANTGQPTFVEIGYGVDQIFRFLHTEVVYSRFANGKGEWRFLLGGNFSFSIQPRTYDRNVETGISF